LEEFEHGNLVIIQLDLLRFPFQGIPGKLSKYMAILWAIKRGPHQKDMQRSEEFIYRLSAFMRIE